MDLLVFKALDPANSECTHEANDGKEDYQADGGGYYGDKLLGECWVFAASTVVARAGTAMGCDVDER